MIVVDWIKSKVTCKYDDTESTKEEEIQLMERGIFSSNLVYLRNVIIHSLYSHNHFLLGENDTLQNTNKRAVISEEEKEVIPELTSGR